MSKLIDLTGQRFGRLIVVCRGEDLTPKSGGRKVRWYCKCDCGNDALVTTQNLLRGVTKSCGCFARDYDRNTFTTDMTGWVMKEHGVKDSKVKVINLYKFDKNGAEWNCVCECGNHFVANGRYLRRGRIKSCGCSLNPNIVDMTGWVMKEHGVPDSRITVVKYIGTSNDRKALWECVCECGKVFIANGKEIRSGHTLSCGCLKVERTISANTTHGESASRLYKIYAGMKDRCYNKNNKRYDIYGQKGIKICDEWLNSYEAFRDWAMSNGYKEDLTIDRINSNGNYCPENCRWTTAEVQANNTSRNHLLTYNGETKTMSQWAKEVGLSYYTLRNRINCLGWNVDKSLTTPPRKIKRGCDK